MAPNQAHRTAAEEANVSRHLSDTIDNEQQAKAQASAGNRSQAVYWASRASSSAGMAEAAALNAGTATARKRARTARDAANRANGWVAQMAQ